MKGLTI